MEAVATYHDAAVLDVILQTKCTQEDFHDNFSKANTVPSF
jgi:hypothetical protein